VGLELGHGIRQSRLVLVGLALLLAIASVNAAAFPGFPGIRLRGSLTTPAGDLVSGSVTLVVRLLYLVLTSPHPLPPGPRRSPADPLRQQREGRVLLLAHAGAQEPAGSHRHFGQRT
jgi:hypothetical protein